MKRKKYEVFDHTADIGLRAFGACAHDVFIHAAEGMFALISPRNKAEPPKANATLTVSCTAANYEELLVAWLNELIAIADTRRCVATEYDITRLTPQEMCARIRVAPLGQDAGRTEIKAATYHCVMFEQGDAGWRAEVLFDI